MKPAAHPTALHTRRLLAEAGLPADVVEFDRPTRTSAEAAEAIGCALGQIAKSVVLRDTAGGGAVVVVASGDRRVCERKVAAALATTVGRADAAFVREATGFAIGGVSPVGLPPAVRVLLDRDLLRFERIWAAAGTPFSVFPLSPSDLPALTGGRWCDVRVDG